jgi:hypothetical protein
MEFLASLMICAGVFITMKVSGIVLCVWGLRAHREVRGRGERAKFWIVHAGTCVQHASEMRVAAVRRVYVTASTKMTTSCGVPWRSGELWFAVETPSGDRESPGATTLVPQKISELQVPHDDEAIGEHERQLADIIARATDKPCVAGAADGVASATTDGAPWFLREHDTNICCGKPCCCGEEAWDGSEEGWTYEMPRRSMPFPFSAVVALLVGIALIATGATTVRTRACHAAETDAHRMVSRSLTRAVSRVPSVPHLAFGVATTLFSLPIVASFVGNLNCEREYRMLRGRGDRAKLWIVHHFCSHQEAQELRISAVRRVLIIPGVSSTSRYCGALVQTGTLVAVAESGERRALTSLRLPSGDEALEDLERRFADAIASATGAPCLAGPLDGLSPPPPPSSSSSVPLLSSDATLSEADGVADDTATVVSIML